jgi:hypothetical protein
MCSSDRSVCPAVTSKCIKNRVLQYYFSLLTTARRSYIFPIKFQEVEKHGEE